MDTPSPQAVLDFWFEDGLSLGWPSQNPYPRWFGGGADMDRLITQRFGALVDTALSGGLAEWEADPLQRLALLLLLDQFTRNVHRGSARAFAGDGRAQALVRQALAQDDDHLLPLAGRLFLHMPLMHAEDPVQQRLCVHRLEALQAQAPEALRDTLGAHVKAAREHHDIVARFGRFPHRNAVLGRESTPEETAFLRDGPRFGQ